jgi:aquaporin Z
MLFIFPFYYIMGKYLVELLGTMFLVFVIFATGNYLAIGAALAIAVLLGGPISGGAFNPAVVMALYSAGKLQQTDIIPYILMEVLGGLAGFYLYSKL